MNDMDDYKKELTDKFPSCFTENPQVYVSIKYRELVNSLCECLEKDLPVYDPENRISSITERRNKGITTMMKKEVNSAILQTIRLFERKSERIR